MPNSSCERTDGRGNLPLLKIHNTAATAEISLAGGHLISYIPAGGSDLLWLSASSHLQTGLPIRGGIPVCWPWFGAAPADSPLQAGHGLARLQLWELEHQDTPSPDLTVVTLRLDSSPETLAIWPYAFTLRIHFYIGRQLSVSLITENRDHRPFTINQALHTYFAISDIERISVNGFDGEPFADTVAGRPAPQGVQNGPIRFSAETDLVFPASSGSAEIIDEGWNRRIRIEKTGSASAVVWNPWINKAKAMPDFGDLEYRNMVCVETCNVRADARTLPPESSHTLRATLSCLQL